MRPSNAAWQQDADLRTAFSNSIGWWQARLAAMLGPARLQQALRGLDYGNHDLGTITGRESDEPGVIFVACAVGGSFQ